MPGTNLVLYGYDVQKNPKVTPDLYAPICIFKLNRVFPFGQRNGIRKNGPLSTTRNSISKYAEFLNVKLAKSLHILAPIFKSFRTDVFGVLLPQIIVQHSNFDYCF